MDVFQCEMTQSGVNVDHPLPPTAAIWWAGGEAQGPSEETWESLCIDDVPPLSNWGKANMIRPNLKDDQCLSPQRLFIVMCVLLRELLRGGSAQFDDSIKLLFELKDVIAKTQIFFFFFNKTHPRNPIVSMSHHVHANIHPNSHTTSCFESILFF